MYYILRYGTCIIMCGGGWFIIINLRKSSGEPDYTIYYTIPMYNFRRKIKYTS